MLRRFSLAATLILAAPSALAAQYFGQNRVQYTKFNFEVIKTEHFDIYFYERERAAAMDAGRIAERAYGRLSRILNHEFKERKPIILYASHSDFQQTNALGGDIGEGTGGVTDFLKHRAIMPFTGSYRDFEHVLMHEMVHQFQYDTWARGRAGPLSTIIAVNRRSGSPKEWPSISPSAGSRRRRRCGSATRPSRASSRPSSSSPTIRTSFRTVSATPSGATSGPAGETRRSAPSCRAP
jgi:hypothetical protein